MLRKSRVILALAGVVCLLISCTGHPGSLYSTHVDLERAQAIWRDPWVAPPNGGVPGVAYGSNGGVSRSVGSRETYHPGLQPVAAVSAEVSAALEHGWTLVAAECVDANSVARLTKGADLDAAAIAEVTADSEGQVTVTAVVPHHLDGDWPALDPLMLEESCLAGGHSQPLGKVLDVQPQEGNGRIGDIDDNPDHEWRSDSPSDSEAALFAEITNDSWLGAQGQLLRQPRLTARDERRQAPQLVDQLPLDPEDPRDSVAQLVESAVDWELTWVTCSSGGSVAASLRRTTKHGMAVARLTVTPDAIERQVVLPIQGGPTADWLAAIPTLEHSECLGSAPLSPGILIEGEPAVLPTAMTPFVS